MNAGVGLGALKRPFPLGRRGALVLLLGGLGVWAFVQLDLSLLGLGPTPGGRTIAADFFSAALHPTLDYEAAVPGDTSFVARLFSALGRTILFAAAGLALALWGGVVMGPVASSSWWAPDPGGAQQRGLGRLVAPALKWFVRVTIALMRSVHELLWAVLFMTAMGVSSGTAVVAIAIPYAGTLAKVFSEMLDESSPRASEALRAAGASSTEVFLFGRLPAALPEMLGYTFYRFECALRSAAVMGFFGYETLGYFLRQSFENFHYRETWTYLYVFLGLVLFLEGWSILLRRRINA